MSDQTIQKHLRRKAMTDLEYYIVRKDEMSEVLPSCVQGKFFTAKFVKKDGDFRVMNCRLGVKKHLKGGFDHNDRTKYLTVYDVKQKGYRNIPIERLIEISCGNLSINNWSYTANNVVLSVSV